MNNKEIIEVLIKQYNTIEDANKNILNLINNLQYEDKVNFILYLLKNNNPLDLKSIDEFYISKIVSTLSLYRNEFFNGFTEEDFLTILSKITNDFDILYCYFLNNISDKNKKNILKNTISKFYNVILSYGNDDLKLFILENEEIIIEGENPNLYELIISSLNYLTILQNNDLLNKISLDKRIIIIKRFFRNYKLNYNINNNIISCIPANVLNSLFYESTLSEHFINKYKINPKTEEEANRINEIIPHLVETNFDILNEKDFAIKNFIIDMKMPFEKAIFFIVNDNNLTEEEKLKILSSLYPNNYKKYKGYSIKDIHKMLIKKIFNEIKHINLKNSNLNSILLEDLLQVGYQDDFFNGIDIQYIKCKKFIPSSYEKIFLNQIIKRICEKYNLDIKSSFVYQLDFRLECNVVSSHGYFNSIYKELKINFYQILNLLSKRLYKSKQSSIPYLGSEINTVFHELRHAKDFKDIHNCISYKNLLYVMDLLIENHDSMYYNDNYRQISYENNARAYAIYDTYYFIKEIDENTASLYLKEHKEEFNKLQSDLKNIQIRNINEDELFSYFFELIPKEKIKEYRTEFKVLSYIIDENGILYSYNKIKDKLDLLQNLDKNDPNFQEKNNERLLYINYLKRITKMEESKKKK